MPRQPLPGRYRDLLVDGPGLDQPLHSALLTLCHAWKRCAWSRAEALAELRDSGNQLGVMLRRRSNWERQFDRAWNKAMSVDTTDKSFVRVELNEYRLAADAMPWNWKGGTTDRLTYEALLILCEDRGRFSASASIRDLALLSAMEPRTVSNSLNRLASRRLAQRLTSGSGRHAAIWKPQSPTVRPQPSHRSSRARFIGTHCSPAEQNASGKPGNTNVPLPKLSLRQILSTDAMAVLTPSDVRVLSLVSAEPRDSARAVARALGIGPATASKTLDHLLDLGLVARGTWGWTTAANYRAVLASLSAENDGFKDRLRERFDKERRQYQDSRSWASDIALAPVSTGRGEELLDVVTGEVVEGAPPF